MTSHEPDLDMEELEARLYSQVYHSSEGDSVPSVTPQTQPATYNRPRYFNANTQSRPYYNPSYVGSSESLSHAQNISRPGTSSTQTPSSLNPQLPNSSDCDQPVFYDHRFGFPVNNIFINFEPPRKRNRKKNKPKVKQLSRKQRRKLQSQEDKKRNKLKAAEPSKERVLKIAKDQRKVLDMFRQEGKTDLLIKHGFWERNRDFARKTDRINEDVPADSFFPFREDKKPKFISQTERLEKETPRREVEVNNEVESEIINLIESDNNSDCEINETAAPEVVVISEDEQETKSETKMTNLDDSNDVVFVEPPKKEATTCEDTQSACSSVARKPEADRVELLGTPESTNDFLDNSFTSAQNSEEASLKVCVDEESDSASEFDPPKVFKEKEFEGTGADSFSELNLDSFTDYIASKASGKKVVQQSSESSSESDYEEDKAKIVEKEKAKKTKYDSISEDEFVINEGGSKLPALSPIDSEEDEVLTSAKMPTSASEELARSSTPTRPAEVEQKAPASKKAKKEAQKRKFHGNADNVQAKKQKLHRPQSDNIQSNVVSSGQPELAPFEDVSETEFFTPEDSCRDLTNVENPARKLQQPPNNKLMRFSDYWTDDMYKFYYESWGQEYFSVEEEQRKMSDDPAMWKIIGYDQIHIQLLSKGPRCHRCREFGHKYFSCRKIIPPPKCILCGLSGHVETRCPNKLCTSCGCPSQYSTTYCSGCARTRHVECDICSMPGHHSRNCPDLWRRYYLTTSEGPLKQPEDHALKPAQDRWCCGCGSRGHFESDCYYYNRTHPPSSPYIHSYDEIYPRIPQDVDPGNPSPGPSRVSTSPELDIQQPGKKTRRQRRKEMEEREAQRKDKYLKFSFTPNSQTYSPLSSQKHVRYFVRLDGVDVKGLLSLKGPYAFYYVVRDFRGCRITVTEDRNCRYSYELEGPSEHATTARYAVGAMLFDHIMCTTKKWRDLIAHFSCEEDFTPEALRKYFELLDSNKEWTRLAEATRKKAVLHRQTGAALRETLPPEAMRAIEDRAEWLQMSLNCVILAKANVLNSERSLKILKEAANGVEVDQQELKRAYNHIFRNTTTDDIDYRKLIPFLSFTGELKRDCDQMLSHGQALCVKHNLTQQLQSLKNLYLKMAQSYSRHMKVKFKKVYGRIVEEASDREQKAKVKAEKVEMAEKKRI